MAKFEVTGRSGRQPALPETIFALASGRGVAAIAIIRISGPAVDHLLSCLTGKAPPPPRRAVLRDLRDAQGALIDRAMILRFQENASYTGESAAEIHCHGGRAVVASVLDALGRSPGCRLAEPGEFTRRAFEAGRIDLAEVEALGDLLAAETELQRRQAARGLGGALHRQAENWRGKLVHGAALLEATIDWADEEVPEDVGPEVAEILSDVKAGIESELMLSAGAERLREGFEVAILGAPNAGKSSLFNTLAGREAAITSTVAGTTRDVLELRYDLGGLPVVFLDTAGLRDTDDDIESAGVARAVARAKNAAMRLFLRSADAPEPPVEASLWRPGDLRVWTKSDLGEGTADVAISVLLGTGLGELLDRTQAELSGRVSESGLVGHIRQRRALEDAAKALAGAETALNGSGDGEGAETVAEDLRTAFRALDRLIGRVGVEDVLDAVFTSFCLGK